jgi:starch-binding outer membrane protein, SusD/RagB family
MSRKTFRILLYLAGTGLLSCAKLVEVPSPPTELTSDNVYTTDATAIAVLTGIYTEIATNSVQVGGTIDAISVISALSADELTLDGGAANSNTVLVQYYQNKLTSGSSMNPGASIWSDLYSNLYVVNIALERLPGSATLTPAVRQQLIGEAKFLRAFFYFYLVNLYGAVPLVTGSNYITNASLSRTPIPGVYSQIIADLSDAQTLLSNGYVGSDAITNTTERVRPNKWAALALLARTYLYTQNWDSAQILSTQLINNTSLYQLDSLNAAFLKNSTEAIWQLQPVNAGWNTEDARVFIIPPTGPTSNSSTGYPVYLSPQLLSAFESGDQRRLDWVDSVSVNGLTYYYPYKYKSATLGAPVTEYTMVFRLGEQYLIRAEAEAHGAGDGLNAAITDLNTIRYRAGLSGYSGGNDPYSLASAILHERQVEMFTEWGHRWLDLKRTSSIDSVMEAVAPSKGTIWISDWQYYPLPLYDITQDPNLTQNPGY